jgi:protein-disulfide isomerase
MQLHRQWIGCLLTLIALGCPSVPSRAESIKLITAAGQEAMLIDPGTEPIGPADADVTIVEYFDYNCPYCRKMAPVLQGLLAQDPHVRLVYKDWPILGGVSVYAARAALAAQWQHKYRAAHDALFSGPSLSSMEQVDTTLRHAGINLDTLAKDRSEHAAQITALLERNDEETHALSLRGTPGIIVGRQLLPGIVNLEGLKQLVADARSMK